MKKKTLKKMFFFASLYRHFLTLMILSPILYCSAHISALRRLYTSHSFCVPHPFHILPFVVLRLQSSTALATPDTVLGTIHCL